MGLFFYSGNCSDFLSASLSKVAGSFEVKLTAEDIKNVIAVLYARKEIKPLLSWLKELTQELPESDRDCEDKIAVLIRETKENLSKVDPVFCTWWLTSIAWMIPHLQALHKAWIRIRNILAAGIKLEKIESKEQHEVLSAICKLVSKAADELAVKFNELNNEAARQALVSMILMSIKQYTPKVIKELLPDQRLETFVSNEFETDLATLLALLNAFHDRMTGLLEASEYKPSSGIQNT